jgi:hypothetical protein
LGLQQQQKNGTWFEALSSVVLSFVWSVGLETVKRAPIMAE